VKDKSGKLLNNITFLEFDVCVFYYYVDNACIKLRVSINYVLGSTLSLP